MKTGMRDIIGILCAVCFAGLPVRGGSGHAAETTVTVDTVVADTVAVDVTEIKIVEEKEITDNASRAFVNMPFSLLPLLDKSARLDLLDYYANGSTHTVMNNLGGQSRILSETPEYLKIQISPSDTLEIASFPYKKTRLVAMVETIGSEGVASDSRITFLDKDFRHLKTADYFKAPGLKDFFPRGVKIADVEDCVPLVPVRLAYSPANQELTASLRVDEIMSEECKKKLAPYMLPQIRYVWNGKKFVIKKK